MKFGAWKDTIEKEIADIRVLIAISRDHTEQVSSVFDAHQKATQEYMKRNTEVLEGLIVEMKATRSTNAAQHQDIMEIVIHGNSVAGRAVDEAHLAANKAEKANESAVRASTNLSTMTRATLVAVTIALGAIGALSFGLMSQYGIPIMHRILDTFGNIFGAKMP
jgi:hypothetical protein